MEKALITVSGRNMPKFEAISDANKARLVARQFERVENALGNAVQEMVVFGAILEAIDETLKKKNAKRNTNAKYGGGDSLKSWLALHCPDVNYNRAVSYLQAARGVRELAKIAEDVPLLPLMGENPLTDAHMEKQRKRVMDIVAKSSLRLLRGAGAGHRTGKAADASGEAVAPRSKVENAVAVIWPMVMPILKHRSAWLAALKLLPAAKLEETEATVAEFLGEIRREKKSRR